MEPKFKVGTPVIINSYKININEDPKGNEYDSFETLNSERGDIVKIKFDEKIGIFRYNVKVRSTGRIHIGLHEFSIKLNIIEIREKSLNDLI
jgi:hypothetical protein